MILIPDFIKGDDYYGFTSTTISNTHDVNTFFSRDLTTSDGEKWKLFQFRHQINTDRPAERPIHRIDGFLVQAEQAAEVEISQSTLGKLKSEMQPYYEEFRQRKDGSKPIRLAEPLKLPTGPQGVDVPMKELSAYNIGEEVQKFRAAQEKNERPKAHQSNAPKGGLIFGKGLAIGLGLGVAAVAGISWVLAEQVRDKPAPHTTSQR